MDSELVYVKKFMTWFKKQGIEMGMSDFEKIIGTPYAEAIDYFMEFRGAGAAGKSLLRCLLS